MNHQSFMVDKDAKLNDTTIIIPPIISDAIKMSHKALREKYGDTYLDTLSKILVTTLKEFYYNYYDFPTIYKENIYKTKKIINKLLKKYPELLNIILTEALNVQKTLSRQDFVETLGILLILFPKIHKKIKNYMNILINLLIDTTINVSNSYDMEEYRKRFKNNKRFWSEFINKYHESISMVHIDSLINKLKSGNLLSIIPLAEIAGWCPELFNEQQAMEISKLAINSYRNFLMQYRKNLEISDFLFLRKIGSYIVYFQLAVAYSKEKLLKDERYLELMFTMMSYSLTPLCITDDNLLSILLVILEKYPEIFVKIVRMADKYRIVPYLWRITSIWHLPNVLTKEVVEELFRILLERNDAVMLTYAVLIAVEAKLIYIIDEQLKTRSINVLIDLIKNVSLSCSSMCGVNEYNFDEACSSRFVIWNMANMALAELIDKVPQLFKESNIKVLSDAIISSLECYLRVCCEEDLRNLVLHLIKNKLVGSGLLSRLLDKACNADEACGNPGRILLDAVHILAETLENLSEQDPERFSEICTNEKVYRDVGLWLVCSLADYNNRWLFLEPRIHSDPAHPILVSRYGFSV